MSQKLKHPPLIIGLSRRLLKLIISKLPPGLGNRDHLPKRGNQPAQDSIFLKYSTFPVSAMCFTFSVKAVF